MRDSTPYMDLVITGVTPEHIRVNTTPTTGTAHVHFGDNVDWFGKPETLRSVMAEIERKLPARHDTDAVLARFKIWQDKGLGTVDSLRLATGPA